MKKTIACLIFLWPFLGFTQIKVIKAEARPGGQLTWRITISIVCEKGYRVYADNPKEGVDGPRLTLGDSLMEVLPTTYSAKSFLITDPIFENRPMHNLPGELIVYTGLQAQKSPPATIRAGLSAFVSKDNQFVPVNIPFEINLPGGVAARKTDLKIRSVQIDHPLHTCGQTGHSQTGQSSMWRVFILGFLGGLLALLTPCVFPMIPVTVSFFTGKSQDKKQAVRKGIVYGGCILLIYLSASLPFHLITGVRPELLNNIATSAPLNLVFFFIFLGFALSFFGFFELRLPYGVANRTNSHAGLGTLGGIFFMALTLCIVSFSCTGPILGTLLVGSLSGGAWPLTAGLAGFGLSLALPFGLFAVFPHWLQNLPRSGGWMETVKKTLAFIELALACKFLSNADLVMHWGILSRERFILIWLAIAISLTSYLFLRAGKAVAVVSLGISLYIASGLFGGKLELFSGFPPPDTRHLKADVVNDYAKALSMAKDQHKALLIDFTGWACVNCRKMEEQVWTDPEVSAYIREHFILLSLYVDDKQRLPAEEQGGDLENVGAKWAAFQIVNFKQSAQPLYAILNEKEELVNEVVGYTPDRQAYLNWLRCGAEN